MPKEALDFPDQTASKHEINEKIVDVAQNEDGIWLRV